MSRRANWHVPEAATSADPFADVESLPEPLPVNPSRKELERHLADLMREEAALECRGILCPIKDRPDSVCAVCPLRNRVPGREPLCRVGVAQERTTMRLATHDERVDPAAA